MKLNDKDAAVNLYFTNEPLEMSNGGQKAAFSGWRGISKEKRDDNFDFAVISAPFGKNPEMKPPEYDTIFPSIATHALVSTYKSVRLGQMILTLMFFFILIIEPST